MVQERKKETNIRQRFIRIDGTDKVVCEAMIIFSITISHFLRSSVEGRIIVRDDEYIFERANRMLTT